MPKCTYCGKELGSNYSFSYGLPGIERVYGCSRLVCRMTRRRGDRTKACVRRFVLQLVELLKDI